MASFLLGLATDGGRLLQVPDEYTTRTGMYSFYVRDQWQPSRNLTLNFGTRYEYFPLPTREDRGMERYNFATNQMLVCGLGTVPKDCGTTVGKMYFSPRIGIVYRAKEKTVLRGGFGVNWDPWNLARPLRTNYPVLAALNIAAPNALGWATTLTDGLPQVPVPDLGNGVIPVPSNYAVTTTDDKYTRGYILNWNATIERQLGAGFVGQVAYVGNHSVHTPSVLDLNAGQVLGADRAGQPLFARFGRTAGTSLVDGIGYSIYHSLQSQVNRRFSSGIQLGAGSHGLKSLVCVVRRRIMQDLASRHWITSVESDRTQFRQDIQHADHCSVRATVRAGQALGSRQCRRQECSEWVADQYSHRLSERRAIQRHGGCRCATHAWKRSASRSGEARGAKAGRNRRWQALLRLHGLCQRHAAPLRKCRVQFSTRSRGVQLGPGPFPTDSLSERVHLEFRAEAFNWTNTAKFNNPSGGINSLQLNPDGTFRTGVFEITGTNAYGRDVAERIFRLGLGWHSDNGARFRHSQRGVRFVFQTSNSEADSASRNNCARG